MRGFGKFLLSLFTRLRMMRGHEINVKQSNKWCRLMRNFMSVLSDNPRSDLFTMISMFLLYTQIQLSLLTKVSRGFVKILFSNCRTFRKNRLSWGLITSIRISFFIFISLQCRARQTRQKKASRCASCCDTTLVSISDERERETKAMCASKGWLGRDASSWCSL